MEKYHLLVLSESRHPEGYLSLALEALVSVGKASEGFDTHGTPLMRIVYDKANHPYLAFKTEDIERVKTELQRKAIIPEGLLFGFDYFREMKEILNSDIHAEIQERHIKCLNLDGLN